jgi:hypothetical protein
MTKSLEMREMALHIEYDTVPTSTF